MKPLLGGIFILSILATLQGCLTSSDSGREQTESDTSDVFLNGTRKPRMPKVSYRTHDSLVHLRIYGTDPGEEREYWVYRNGELRDQPVGQGWFASGTDSAGYLYTLVDRLESEGLYEYQVRYGYQESRTSRPSPAYVYFYPGPSPSGSVSLELGADQRVTITLSHADSLSISQAYFERKFGSDGEVTVLDTAVRLGQSPIRLLDSHFVHLDTMIYYRAYAMDAVSETWLAPTSWDSIPVSNRTWTLVPGVDIRNLGVEMRATLIDPLEYSGKGWYFLYRNTSPSQEGKTKVDSVAMRGNSTLPLRDTASQVVKYYYWVEALDPYGRLSLRSVPEPVAFTGIPRGPDILSVQVYASHIQVRVSRDAKATAYVLLRRQDWTEPETVVDTLPADPQGNGPVFVDIPPGNGHWYYSVVTLFDGKSSTPGSWSLTSESFRYEPSYGLLSTSIVNLGVLGVEAVIEPVDQARFVLLRSRNPDGTDSLAVDTLSPTDTRVVLKDKPPLGTWYYRVVRFDKPSTFSNTLFRTDLVRIDYTGKPVGPAIRSLTIYGGGIEAIFNYSPDAVAFVVERSPDTAQAWTTVDTLPVFNGNASMLFDRPPANGFWSYRARTLLANLSLTDPGSPMRTRSAWTYSVTYENTLLANIANRGPRVECPLTTVASYGYYLKRSLLGDYSQPSTVDSIHAGESRTTLEDVPSLGTYYYWVERMPDPGRSSSSIYRSLPFKVEFTGAPEVVSLTQGTRGVVIRYATLGLGDTLEVWRSAGPSPDSASFALKATLTATLSASSYEDNTVDAGKADLYHYRLALRREGKSTGKGPFKTLYYQP